MEKFFRNQAQTIQVYAAKERTEDPYEENTVLVYLNPIPVKAIVSDIAFEKIRYKLPGINTSKMKEIIIRSRDESIIDNSRKVTIDGDDYEGWRDDGRMQKKIEDEYIRYYLYIRK